MKSIIIDSFDMVDAAVDVVETAVITGDGAA